MMEYYRIHKGSESLDTILDSRRPDGWVADDESYETQPMGVSCCQDLDTLARYIRHYGMCVRQGDVLVRVIGSLSYDRDRDLGVDRVIATGYEVLGCARTWVDTGEVAT